MRLPLQKVSGAPGILQGLCACGARRIRGLDAFDTPWVRHPPSLLLTPVDQLRLLLLPRMSTTQPLLGNAGPSKFSRARQASPNSGSQRFQDWTDSQRSARDQLFCALQPSAGSRDVTSGYFGRGHTDASQVEICIYEYMATPPFTQKYFRQKSVGNQPSRPSMQGQGIRRAHTAALPWLYHAPQAQPCLSYVEICIGLMLVADLAWVCVCVWGEFKPVPFAANHSAAMRDY